MAVKGAILGDILGSPYEFYRPDDFNWETVPLTGKLPVGFTDDTAIVSHNHPEGIKGAVVTAT